MAYVRFLLLTGRRERGGGGGCKGVRHPPNNSISRQKSANYVCTNHQIGITGKMDEEQKL